ncbi:UNVERIFIED_CONTAM: hypothetical protein PYX00_006685 [Menopon gallinae]|uniref:Carboxylic ester hydrolase n=1 Tax=Menopon gallinae TaxID=328185 RepID=A0AAW2HX55_9NEOP
MNFYIKILIICSLTNFIKCDLGPDKFDGTVVDLPNLGRLKGRLGKTYFTKRDISLFYGINYARPPSGTRRFLPPEPFGPWTGTYDATMMRQRCPQVDMDYYPSPDPGMINEKKDKEDCLVVNVFSPNVTDKAKLPVMVYLHGGSFIAGSAYDFQPDFLLEKDIVLVVPQYRLGVLGFLCLELDDLPGNMAMMDIHLALKWVKQNILYFGGDPSKITVVGQSAGAAAASSLLISPLVKRDLFNQMIIQSGSVLGPWVIEEKPIASARIIAEKVKCPIYSIRDMANCLKMKPAHMLMEAQYQAMSSDLAIGKLNTVGRGLVVQNWGLTRFLTKHPVEEFTTGPRIAVPIMGGVTRDEGSVFFTSFYDKLKNIRVRDGYLQRNVTRDILESQGIDDPYGTLTDLYHNMLFKAGENQTLEDMLPGFVDLFGTIMLKQSTYHVLRSMSNSRPAYAYAFNFYGNISKVRASSPDWNKKYPFPSGVAHSDELGYLFPTKQSNYTERELNMVKELTKYWTNFVIYGSPNGKDVAVWPSMSTPFGPYLRFTNDQEVHENFNVEYEMNAKEGFLYGSASTISVCITALMTFAMTLLLFF